MTPSVTETKEQGPSRTTTSFSSTPQLVDQKINHAFERKSKYPKDSPRQKALDDMLAEMNCMDMQPFSIVEDRGFRRFIQALDPRYEIPGRKKITQVIIPRIYKKEEESLKKELENTEHIALTTDEWTSRTTKGYMAVTAHFIDKNMTLQSRVLETRRVTSSVTSENIKDELNHVMDSWSIQQKVFAIVTDNAANMKLAINLLNKRHVPCSAHTLNLAVQDAVNKVAGLNAIREKVRNIVGYFHRSRNAALAFEAEQRKEIETGEHFSQKEKDEEHSQVEDSTEHRVVDAPKKLIQEV